ncbi:MAG TPA: hypothetical protein DCK76_11230 [Desulfotomaculum sp.]|nr:hypothetical protein [Desulfotomaculum sp.]HBY04352.1 hypothetical protein [Desulfotomaculum sp.]
MIGLVEEEKFVAPGSVLRGYASAVSSVVHEALPGLEMEMVEQTELNYFKSNFKTLQEQYSGRWIAICGNEVVSEGNDFGEDYRGAKSKGCSVPFVVFVKKRESGSR